MTPTDFQTALETFADLATTQAYFPSQLGLVPNASPKLQYIAIRVNAALQVGRPGLPLTACDRTWVG